MTLNRVIKVECKCGKLLFKYHKNKRGRLIKCFLSQIKEDNVGILDLPTGARPVCPVCGKEIGIIKLIHGRAALKINQGTVKKTGT